MKKTAGRDEAFFIESWNEWDPLEHVLVGSAIGAQVPKEDISLRAINYAHFSDGDKIPTGPYPAQVIEETEEDLARFCRELEKLGVKVDRPQPVDPSREFGNARWRTDGYYQYCPRDSVLVHGRTVIEAPMPLRARYFETESMRPLFLKGLESGATWISAPKPMLSDDCYQTESVHKEMLTLKENEPCFDAANVLRCGRDLFYLVSNSGNKLGALWLQNTLGPQFRVHRIENVYSYMHIDSTISLLRPGLALLNPSRIKKDKVPAPLNKWDAIWCEDPVDIGFYGNYAHASAWVGMNLFMVRPDLAVVEERQLPLIRQLEKNKIHVLPLPIRHARTLGGSFHCVTLDLKRNGKLESYF